MSSKGKHWKRPDLCIRMLGEGNVAKKSAVRKKLSALAKRNMARRLADPEKRAAIIAGCKRPSRRKAISRALKGRKKSSAHRDAVAAGMRAWWRDKKKSATVRKSRKSEKYHNRMSRAIKRKYAVDLCWKRRRDKACAGRRGKMSAKGRAGLARARVGHWAGTKPELIVDRYLRTLGLVAKSQYLAKWFPTHAFDFAIPSARLLIEVDGCYWHACRSCSCAAVPNSKESKRRRRSRMRDRYIEHRVRQADWTLVRVWEHDVKSGMFRGIIEMALRDLAVDLAA